MNEKTEIKKENPREYRTKTGEVRTDKLLPIVFYDNRNGGSYCIGNNKFKRDKRRYKRVARR